jgi:hypothetical protein
MVESSLLLESLSKRDMLNHNNNNHFEFKSRNGRLDWRRIASIDLDLVKRDSNIQVLQDNIDNLTFCNIDSEFSNEIDPNFLKLFKMCQFIIEYLMVSLIIERKNNNYFN